MGFVYGVWDDIAQVCLNGHVTNDSTRKSPARNADFCNKCGAKTITNCQECEKPIRGYHHHPRVSYHYDRPAYCEYCGKPFSWTAAAIAAAKELAEETELNTQEKDDLKNSIEDLTIDSPRTIVAATRFKRLATKAGKVTLDGFGHILTSVLTEAAKKIIFPA